MPFEPGKSGNPRGRPCLPDDLHLISKITKTQVEGILSKYLAMSAEDLEIESQRKDIPAIEAMTAGIAHRAVVNGDTLRADFLLNRLIGKVKEDAPPPPPIQNINILTALPQEAIALALRMNKKKLLIPNE